MASASDLDEGFMERCKFRVLELAIVEAEEIIHDYVSGQRWEGMREVQGLFATLKLPHACRKRLDVAMDDVNKFNDGPPREPVR